jgi:hypothetical protein
MSLILSPNHLTDEPEMRSPHALKRVPEDIYALACQTLNQIIEIAG